LINEERRDEQDMWDSGRMMYTRFPEVNKGRYSVEDLGTY
jgi:hypothetical protein